MSEAEAGLQLETVGDVMRVSEEALAAAVAADDKANSSEKKDDTVAASSGGAGDGDQNGDKPVGVVTADGKSVIPYSVLEKTRDRGIAERRAREEAEARAKAESEARAQAEETAKKLQAELDAMRNAGGNAGDGKTQQQADDRVAALKEQANAIRDELPAMAGMFDTLIAEIEDTRTAAAQARTTVETREANEKKAGEDAAKTAEADVAKRVREAIDSNPTLAFWETNDEAAFNKTADFDAVLRSDPEWAAKPFGERFAEAVRLTQAHMPKAAKPPKTPSAEELRANTEKAIQDADKAGSEPHTLTDLPGGASPGADVLENLEAVPAAVLANRMEGMSQRQLDDLLNKFA